MKILVLVKQLHESLDIFAIEQAAQIKDENPEAEIIIATFGNGEEADRRVIEGISIAGDKIYVISTEKDKLDAPQTASYISCGIKKIEEVEGEFDLILLGNRSKDSQTGQICTEIAEILSGNCATMVMDIKEKEKNVFKIDRKTYGGIEKMEIDAPAVVGITKPNYTVRLANFVRIRMANRMEIGRIVVNDEDFAKYLGKEEIPREHVILKEIIEPKERKRRLLINEDDDTEGARLLFNKLKKDKIL